MKIKYVDVEFYNSLREARRVGLGIEAREHSLYSPVYFSVTISLIFFEIWVWFQ